MEAEMYVQIVCCVLVSLAVSLSAWGAPSGLNAIPTADVLDRGVVSLETESSGTGVLLGDDCGRYALFQVGVGNGIELGLDRCLDEPDSWVNVKWRIRDESGGRPGLALGIQGISDGESAQPYVVALKSLGKTRVHAGLIMVDRKTRWLFGLDRPLGSRVTLQADRISGDENSVTYGVAVSLSEALSLTLAKSSGNAPGTGDGHVINLAWSSSL